LAKHQKKVSLFCQFVFKSVDTSTQCLNHSFAVDSVIVPLPVSRSHELWKKLSTKEKYPKEKRKVGLSSRHESVLSIETSLSGVKTLSISELRCSKMF